MANPVSDEYLEMRVKALHKRLASTRLKARGLEATTARLQQSLRWSTVSVVETTIHGKAVRIVTTNDAQFYKIMQQSSHTFLLPGEVLGSRPVYVYGPKEPKKRPPRQTIHAEQLGANDARRMGGSGGRIATSNAGCTDRCISLIREEFPEYQHVNPARTSPDPHIHVTPIASGLPEGLVHAGPPSHSVSFGSVSGRPAASERMTAATHVNSGAAADVERAAERVKHIRDPRAMTRATVAADHAVGATRRGFKARTLVIGIKAWGAARKVGKMLFMCFVPLKTLDVVIEVAMALWDREREKEQRKRREKQRTLNFLFIEGRAKIESGIQTFASSEPSVQQFMNAWDRNKNYNGFQYARIRATLDVVTHRPMFSGSGDAIESLTTYSLVSLNVFGTSAAHDFLMEDIGEEKELEKTDEDIVALFKKGQMYPKSLRKTVRRRTLSYTIVPPLLSPFDIVVTKLNNLFLDIANFIAWFSNSEESALDRIRSLNFTYHWDEQLNLSLEFPDPLNAPVCKYCLSYLYAAAKQLSRHPLEQQDLEGNPENPMKGWKRRFWLLMWVLEGENTRHGKNFSYFAGQVKRLVRQGHGDSEISAAIEELYIGARAIWYDLERIERNLYKSEYYYLGPQYKPSE